MKKFRPWLILLIMSLISLMMHYPHFSKDLMLVDWKVKLQQVK